MSLYTGYYNLREHPFRLTPDASFLYMTSQHREALSGLIHSACNRSGLTVMTGEAGTGKTMLLHLLKSWLEKRQFITVYYNNPTLTRDEFFDLLLMEFDVACSSSLKSRQLAVLQEALLRFHNHGRRPIVIVDEAHALPRQLLEEIRLLLNLETPREKLLDIILAGQPELQDMLRRPELRQLKQRVTCFCKLDTLGLAEVREYIQHRLSQAGSTNPGIFPEDTIRLIHEYTHGIPRLVNTLCDNALQTGFALQCPQITTSIIDEAAADLDLVQQERLPRPLVEPLTLQETAPIHVNDSFLDSLAPPPKPVTPSVTVESAAAAAIPAGIPSPNHIEAPPQSDGLGWAVRVTETADTAAATAVNGTRDDGAQDDKMPLESYSSRQKSLGFLAGLIDRWT